MNLVTADNKKIWSKNKKNLLVGNWCVDNEHKYKKTEKKKYLIQKYHWDNKLKFKKDFKYLHKVYNKLLDNLCLNLNKFHKEKNSKQYWEIILYKWLWVYLFRIYDMWEIVRIIKLKNKKLSSKNILFKLKNFTPDDSNEFSTSMMFSNDWNHWIYTEIFKFLGNINYKYINKKEVKPKFWYKKNQYRSANYLLNSISGLPSSEKKYFQNTCFSKEFEITHRIFNRQFRVSQEISLKGFDNSLNMKARLKLIKLSKKEDKFSKFAHSLFKYQIPKFYLEYYQKVKEKIEKSNVPKNPKIIVTSMDHIWNDAFKIYSAQKVSAGAKLYIIQHGGCYGMTDFNLDEKNEIKISDKFLTWGWKLGDKKTLPLFVPQTVYKKRNKKRNAEGLIMPIMDITLVPGQDFTQGSPRNKIEVNNYIENVVKFLSQVDKNILKKSSFKYIEGYKINYTLKSLKYKFPKMKFEDPKKNVTMLSNNFKLIVDFVNSSCFLQSLNLNIPIILIYDKKYCSLRKSAIKDFNMLKKVKIVHNSPDEAAKFVNQNYNNLENWWNSKSLQKVKDKFCYKFARKSNSPLKDLNKVLLYRNN